MKTELCAECRSVTDLRSNRGQATVELVAFIPTVLLVGVVILNLLVAGINEELADHAAEAGAVALLQETDPREAVRKSLPRWAGKWSQVEIRNGRVKVAIRPKSPLLGLGGLLTAVGEADSGQGKKV